MTRHRVRCDNAAVFIHRDLDGHSAGGMRCSGNHWIGRWGQSGGLAIQYSAGDRCPWCALGSGFFVPALFFFRLEDLAINRTYPDIGSRTLIAVTATTTRVNTPPNTTDGTVPIKRAAVPDSKAPSSFELPMKIAWTDATRPSR